MAVVKILLEDNETPEEAEEMLLKALTHHSAGGEHKEDFTQPAARDVVHTLLNEHSKMWNNILKEIFEVIDEDMA